MRKSKSPYQRHNKAPFRYSDLFRAWRDATLRGDENEARRLGEQHTRRWLGALPEHVSARLRAA